MSARPLQNALVLICCVVAVTLLAQVQTSLYATSITVGVYALLAVPLGMIYGRGGMISLAQGGFAAIGGYTSAILWTQMGLAPAITLIPSIAVPALIAYLVSRPILRLPELSMALATLALGILVKVVFESGGSITGGFEGIPGLPPLLIVGDSRIGAHIAIWSLVVVCVYCYDSFCASARGRALNAIHVDRLLAESVGVPVARDLSLLFSIAAGLAGLGGWFYVHYLGFIAPESLSVHLSASLIFMVVIGGRRYSLGPIFGAVFFVVASDLLAGADEANGMIFGAMLILVLVLLPDGLFSLFAWLPPKLRRTSKKPVSTQASSQVLPR